MQCQPEKKLLQEIIKALESSIEAIVDKRVEERLAQSNPVHVSEDQVAHAIGVLFGSLKVRGTPVYNALDHAMVTLLADKDSQFRRTVDRVVDHGYSENLATIGDSNDFVSMLDSKVKEYTFDEIRTAVREEVGTSDHGLQQRVQRVLDDYDFGDILVQACERDTQRIQNALEIDEKVDEAVKSVSFVVTVKED